MTRHLLTLEAAVVAIGLALVLAVANWQIALKQAVIDHGETLLLPLGPRDPRSLMQGDFMVLRFERLPFAPGLDIAELPETGRLAVARDGNDVATAARPLAAREKPEPGELVVAYRREGRRLAVAPDSFFFQEGRARDFESARFAILKVADDGETGLVGLADDRRQPIGP